MKKLQKLWVKYKVAAILVITIALVAIIFAINNTSIDNQEDNPINDVDLVKNIDYGDTITKLSFNDDYKNSLDDINRTIDIYGGITRFQLVKFVHTTLENDNKLPQIISHKLEYEDIQDIPDRYIEPIAICKDTEIFVVNEKKFSGYTFINKEELDNAISNLSNYLKNIQENKEPIDETIEIKEPTIADTILSKEIPARNNIDRLNGESVAVNKDPKTVGELKENIAQIRETNFESNRIKTKFNETGESIEYDFINLEEGLVNTPIISSMTDDIIGEERINGLTVSSTVNFQVKSHQDGIIVLHSDMLNLRDGMLFCMSLGALGIKDNEIVSSGMAIWDFDKEECLVALDDIEIDSIGFIIDEIDLENRQDEATFEMYQEGKVKYYLLLVPVSNSTIQRLWG